MDQQDRSARGKVPFSYAGGCKRRSGFTLVELLVVISIIALLIAILLPSLSRARDSAKALKCLSNVRGLGQAGMLFANEHSNRFQLAAQEKTRAVVDSARTKYAYQGNGEILAWPVALAKYAGLADLTKNYEWAVRADDFADARTRQQYMSQDFQLAVCPSDEVLISTPFYPQDAGGGNDGLMSLPSELNLPDGKQYWGYLSYGINEDVVGADDDQGPNAAQYDCWRYDVTAGQDCRGQLDPTTSCTAGKRLEGDLDRIFDPATVLLLIDAGPESEGEAIADPLGYANLIISAQATGPYLADFQTKWIRRTPKNRHRDGALNVLFADFHGDKVRPTGYWSSETLRDIPMDYDKKVRVSPYQDMMYDD